MEIHELHIQYYGAYKISLAANQNTVLLMNIQDVIQIYVITFMRSVELLRGYLYSAIYN